MYRCQKCGYYYLKQGEQFPRCHYPDNDPFPAPCEYDDDYDDDYSGEDDFDYI